MEEITFNKGKELQNEIVDCKNRIEKLEIHRDTHGVEIVEHYVPLNEKYKGKILLQLEGKDYKKENEAYQLFLDELLTIEDEKLKLLEKEFEEL
jgi:hypothetical protein